jgi:hypothetical protein
MWDVRGEKSSITPQVLICATNRMMLLFAEMAKTMRGTGFRI